MPKAILFRLLTLVGFLVFVGACSDDDNIVDVNTSEIQVTPSSISFSQVRIGDRAVEDLFIMNLSDNPMRILTLELEPRDGGRISDLTLLDENENPLPETPIIVEPRSEYLLKVEYKPVNEIANQGRIRILANDPRYTRESPLFVNVDTLASRPQLDVRPGSVRFARMQPGSRSEQVLEVMNIGSAPLILHEAPVYTGGEDFSIELPERDYPLTLEPYDGELAQESPEKYVLGINVVYVPTGLNADQGEVVLVSNDTRGAAAGSERGTRTVEVRANADAPCILVDGRTRNMGQVPIGGSTVDLVTVTNCGTQPLEISAIKVTEGQELFELRLGDWAVDTTGALVTPVVLAPNASDTFGIAFTPSQPGAERGKVVISSNDQVQPELEIDLLARGSDGICPIADATATIKGVSSAPRTELSAVPLQYIILDGRSSSDPDGSVVSYEWEVLEKPMGTIVTLGNVGNDTSLNRREFRLFTAGTYKIGLNVIDNEGFRSCEQSVVTIQAVPDQKVHIELTWTNPSDPDESDGIGSDVDLHFVKLGPGKWFLPPYDIYYNNSNAGKDDIWAPERPSLDIDVTTGAGPENVTLDNPDECQWYGIGVHYFRQQFGTAYATIRVYINTVLVYEALHKPMTAGGQFWDVARIHWQNGNATILEYDELYPASLAGSAPFITDDMKTSGLCTAQNLY